MPTSLLPNPVNVRINSELPDPANIRIAEGNLPDPTNIKFNLDETKPKESLLKSTAKGFAKGGATFMPKSFWGGVKILKDVANQYPAFTPWAAGTQFIPEGYPEKQIAEVEKTAEYLTPEERRGWTQYIPKAAETLGQMAGSAVSTAGVSTLPAMAVGAGIDRTLRTQKEGESLPKSLLAGGMSGVAEYATEKLPIKYLTQIGLPYLKRLAGGLISDVPGEIYETFIEMKSIDEGLLGKKYTPQEYAKAILDTAATSAMTTGIATTAVQPFKQMPPKRPFIPEVEEVVLPPGEKPFIPSVQEPIKQPKGFTPLVQPEIPITRPPRDLLAENKEIVPPITRPPRDLLEEQQPLPKPENVEIVKPQPKGFTPIEAAPSEMAQPKGFGKPQDLFAKPTEETKIVYGAIDEEVKLLEPKIPLKRRNELFEQARTEGAALMKKRMGVTDYTTLTKPIYRNLLKAEAEKQSAPIEASPVVSKEPWQMTRAELIGISKQPLSSIGDKIEFIRYGKPIKNSVDYSTGQTLKGLSVYELNESGSSKLPIRSEFADRKDVYIGSGTIVGYGSDGEPLVADYSIKKATPLQDEKAYYGGISRQEWKDRLASHKSIVAKAKSEGKPIPPEVLKDYPELQQTHTMPSGEVMPGAEHRLQPAPPAEKEAFTSDERLINSYGEKELKVVIEGSYRPKLKELARKRLGEIAQPKMFEGEKADITPKMEADIQGQQKLFNPKGETELYAGLPIPSIIKSFAKLPGIEKIVGFFNPLKGLSPKADIAYQNIRNKEKGREARVQRFVMNQFDRLSEMPTETREQMFHALTSRESITKLPKEYWRKAESLRSLHKYMGQMAVKRGLLSPETYASNKGEWVKHLYEKYMQEKKDSLNKQQSSMTMQLDWKKRKLPDTSFGVDEQRARGLKEDVVTAVPVGMTEVLTDLSRSDMFDEILNNSELTWQPSVVSVDNGQGGLETWSIGNLQKHIESQGQAVLRNPGNVAMKNELARLQGIMEQAQKESGNVPKGYTQLPSTPAYGKLAGAYVKDAVARDIMPALAMFGKGTSASEFYNAVQKVMTKGMAIFKASKVALNLPSWFRNGGANVIMFNMKGTPLYEIPYWLEQSAVGMMKGTTEYTQAFRQGLFRTKYSDIEINNFLGTSRKLLGQDYSGITETLSGAANLYGKIDDWFKFAIYLEERRKGTDVATAVRQANKWGMDYSLVNPAVKIARQSLVPFASFNYKFVPLFVETAAQRPWIMAKYMAIPLIMLKAVQSMYDMTDEDVRKLVLSLPSYVRKQKTLLPLPHMSPEGNLEWVDIGYFLPWNTEIQAYKAIKEKDMGEMLRTIGIGNPFLDIYALAKSGHQENPPRNPYNGQEIYNRLDDLPTKLFKLLEYNYNLFAPGMATRYGAAGKIAEIGKKDKYGRTVTPLQAMLRFIGVNIIVPTKEQGRIEKVARIKELQSSLYKGFRDARGDKGKQKQLRESFKEKRRKILAGED